MIEYAISVIEAKNLGELRDGLQEHSVDGWSATAIAPVQWTKLDGRNLATAFAVNFERCVPDIEEEASWRVDPARLIIQPQANLGLATTDEMLAELIARMERAEMSQFRDSLVSAFKRRLLTFRHDASPTTLQYRTVDGS